ncbi:MAG: hypothetical protein WAL32_14295 [Terriglobales bacterium]
MVVLGIVNLLLLVVGFLTGLRKQEENRAGADDRAARNASQLTGAAQKG